MAALGSAGRHSEPSRILRWLIGNWTVHVTSRTMFGIADLKAEWILDEKFVRQEYQTKVGNRAATTFQFIAYDALRHRFDIINMSNAEPTVLHSIGSLSHDGQELTAIGEGIDPVTHQIHLVKDESAGSLSRGVLLAAVGNRLLFRRCIRRRAGGRGAPRTTMRAGHAEHPQPVSHSPGCSPHSPRTVRRRISRVRPGVSTSLRASWSGTPRHYGNTGKEGHRPRTYLCVPMT